MKGMGIESQVIAKATLRNDPEEAEPLVTNFYSFRSTRRVLLGRLEQSTYSPIVIYVVLFPQIYINWTNLLLMSMIQTSINLVFVIRSRVDLVPTIRLLQDTIVVLTPRYHCRYNSSTATMFAFKTKKFTHKRFKQIYNLNISNSE